MYRSASTARLFTSHTAFLAGALALSLALLGYLIQADKGLNLWDEGFLWYGVQRVISGEVPIRDFMAYDPGRYYWSAGIMQLLESQGIVALRMTISLFQFIALFVALRLLISTCQDRQNQARFFLLISGFVLFLWMIPQHKTFDIAFSIFLLGAVSFYLHQTSLRRAFALGLLVGFAACFGRNHGVYGVLASLFTLIYASLDQRQLNVFFRSGFAWAAGVLIGFTPILFMLITVPDFAPAFWESIVFLFEIEGTNLPLPVPWPWTVDLAGSFENVTRQFLIGVFFVAILVFAIVGLCWLFFMACLRRQVNPTLAASMLLALPYAHVAFSRADLGHLAQGIFPFLIGVLIMLSRLPGMIRVGGLCLVLLASAWVTAIKHPAWHCWSTGRCESVSVLEDTLQLDLSVAKHVALIQDLDKHYAADGRNVLITPFWPGAYALLEKKSPMWEIYALFPRSRRFQEAEIARIQEAEPGFVIVLDIALNGRDDLRFKHSHTLIYQYIVDHFTPISSPQLSGAELFHAKDAQ